MGESRTAHGDPLLWFRRARDELLAARRYASDGDVVPRIACTLAQQSAEKAIKALILSRGVRPPKTHDLETLAELLPNSLSVRLLPVDLAALTAWAIAGRYPEDDEEATAEDAARAVTQAHEVLAVTEQYLKGSAAQEVPFLAQASGRARPAAARGETQASPGLSADRPPPAAGPARARPPRSQQA